LVAVCALARRHTRTAVAVALGLLVTASLALSVWQTGRSAPWAYFGAHTRAWELGVGALLAVAPARLPRPVAAALTPAGLVAIAAAAVLFTPATAFPGYAALLPVAGAAAVLAGGAARPYPPLGAGPMRLVGRLSYSWYLWHWPFVVIAPYALDRPPGVRLGLAASAAALVAAGLTYVLVENPVRQLAALRARPLRGLALGLGLSAAAATMCLVVGAAPPPGAGAGGWAEPPRLPPGPAAGKRLAGLLAAGAGARAVPDNLTPPLRRAAADRPAPYREGCGGPPLTDSTPRTPCLYGDTAAARTVVLFGDSHAGHWFPALERLAVQRRWRLAVVTKSSCSAASVRVYYRQLRRPFEECVRWRAAALRHIRALRPAAVFLASLGYGEAMVGGWGLSGGRDQHAEWVAGWRATARKLAAAGTDLYAIADTPLSPADVPECLSLRPADPSRCALDRRAAFPEPRRRALVGRALAAEGVTVIDPAPWLCATHRCPVVVGNVLVYRDRHHLTTAYARLLAPLLGALVRGED
jgi:hypothetical protein